MSDRQQLGIASRTPQAHRFAGTRWLELAGRLANRYRKRRHWMGLAMQWPRRLSCVKWLRERWLQTQPSPPWLLNVRLNIDWGSARRASESGIGHPPLANRFSAQRPNTHQAQGPKPPHLWIANHLVMQRFVAPHTSIVLRQLRTRAGCDVHTSVRPLVREGARTDDRLFSKPAAEPASKPEAGRQTQFAFPVHGTSAPAAVPIRAPDVNVAQIADQVMRLMDHRISSWRERRGRS